MARQDGLSQWTDCVSTNMPHLTKPQATVLALWSYGIACTRCCGRLAVATFLGLLLTMKVANVEQRLYEWCLDAEDKAGTKRTSLDVSICFVPLLRWIVRLGWHPVLRIKQGAKFRPAGCAQFVWLRDLVGQVRQRWRAVGTAFSSYDCHLHCTLVAWWGDATPSHGSF